MAMLKDQEVILVNSEFKTYYNFIERCKEAGFEPNIILEISEISMGHKFCAANYGVSVTVDYVAKDLQFDQVAATSFEGDLFPWEIYMITRKDTYPNNVIKNFMKHV